MVTLMANRIPDNPDALLTRGRTAEVLTEAGLPIKANTFATKQREVAAGPIANSTSGSCIAGTTHWSGRGLDVAVGVIKPDDESGEMAGSSKPEPNQGCRISNDKGFSDD
jgi:hypothetical protein